MNLVVGFFDLRDLGLLLSSRDLISCGLFIDGNNRIVAPSGVPPLPWALLNISKKKVRSISKKVKNAGILSGV